MTGLDPNKDHLLEIAVIVTDKDLNVLAEGPNLVIHQPDEVCNPRTTKILVSSPCSLGNHIILSCYFNMYSLSQLKSHKSKVKNIINKKFKK